jgi:predicted pyridoxine 5'-phosphate oxidase superfamily flavin-nucleotide-binding protein
MLSRSQKQLITRFPLGCIATVSSQGRPMVSPKGTFLVVDDKTIGFGHIRSPQTLSNLRANSACEIVFTDPFTRKAVRVAGNAQIMIRSDAKFSDLIALWHNIWGALAKRIRALVLIDIAACADLTTPPYDDGITEAEMISVYQAKYKEIYP